MGESFSALHCHAFLENPPYPPLPRGQGGFGTEGGQSLIRTVPAGACPQFHDAWVGGTPMTNCFENLLSQQIVPLAERS